MKSKEIDIYDLMVKELEIIQRIINRMAINSFIIKSWTVVMFIVALFLKENQAFIAFITILVFWFLDAYFLRIERLYRKVYNWVKDNRLNTGYYLFDLNYKRFEKEEQSILRIMFSITLSLFYGSMFILTLIYVIF